MFGLKSIFFLLIIGGTALYSQETLSKRFIPNHGQVSDVNNQPRPDVLFYTENQPCYFTKKGITYVFSNSNEVWDEVHEEVEELEENDGLRGTSEEDAFITLLANSSFQRHQISMEFLGANEEVNIESGGQSKDYLNYYQDGPIPEITQCYLYDKLTYHELYQGVDVNYYMTSEGNLKYDIILDPFTNPDIVQMKWTGMDSVWISSEGALVVQNRFENLIEKIPSTYQITPEGRVEIGAKYVLEYDQDGNPIVSFHLGDYDRKLPLIIDPWVTNYGGSELESAVDLETDSKGNVIFVGLTTSTTNIAEDGFLDDLTGEVSGFIAKFTSEGDRIWGTYYGGEKVDRCSGVAIDSENNIVVCGNTSSEEGIAESGFQNEFGGSVIDWLGAELGDAFVVKFNPEGERLWSTYYGGEKADIGEDIFVGMNDQIYLSGLTGSDSSTAIVSEDAFQTSIYDDYYGIEIREAFYAIFNSSGERLYGTYFGGDQAEVRAVIAASNTGEVYLAGTTGSLENITTPGAHQEVNAGFSDGFIAKFNESGDQLWGTYYGGESVERIEAVAIDTVGSVYISGETESSTGIAFDGYQMERGSYGPKKDALLAKMDSDGNRIWGTYLGGDENDYAKSVDVDTVTNNVVISGDTYSIDFPVTACAIQPELVGTENAFVSQFFPNGDLYCSSYFGSDHEENSKAAFSDCFIYIIGSSPVTVATPGAFQEEFGGTRDGFLAQIYKSSCGIELPETTIENTFEIPTGCDECDGEITVSVSQDGCVQPVSYFWSTGLVIENSLDTFSLISDLCPGEYWAVVEVNCELMDTLYFDLNSDYVPTANFEMPSSACAGSPVIFTNSSFSELGTIVTYEWSFGGVGSSGEENPEFVFDTAGVYSISLVVENSLSCFDSISAEIEIHPVYSTEELLVVCENSSVIAPDGTVFEAIENTIYLSHLTSIHGCDSTVISNVIVLPDTVVYNEIYVSYGSTFTFPDGYTVEVVNELNHVSVFEDNNGCDSLVDITVIPFVNRFEPPNIFTPGSDNVNNEFSFPQVDVEQFQCVVLNRWGVEVFHFDTITDAWDGTNQTNGEPCTDGVYFYVYTGTFLNGEIFKGHGNIQLIRDE